MKRLYTAYVGTNVEVRANAMNADDWRLERLINRLPKCIGSRIRFVRQPSRRWLRIPMGLLLTVGGRSGPELWIGSKITAQTGWPMDLARNDPR